MSELKLKGPFVRLSDNSISDEDFEADAKLTIDGDWANPEHKEAYLQAVLEALNRRAPEAGQTEIRWDEFPGYPFLPCPVCKGVEGCAHCVPERARAYYRKPQAQAEPAEGREPVASTPGARWRENGEPDPHGEVYDCERAKLAHGEMTDDALANAIYLISAPGHIAIQTAAKERIRWLSRQLYAQPQRPPVPDLMEVLKEVRWRINDVREMLLGPFHEMDEFGAASINLKQVIDILDKAQLTAAPAPERPAIQWSDELKPNSEVHYNHLIGNTPFSRILITWKGWKDDLDMIIDEHPVESAKGKYAGGSIEEAKQTAEKFYLDALKEQPNGQG